MPSFTPADFSAIILSMKVALTATLLSLPFGFALAWLMTFRQFRGKVALDVLINLPLTLPPVVVGYLLLLLLGQKGWLGQHLLQLLGIKLIFTWKAAAIATAVVGFPLLVKAIRIGMESIDEELIQAARTLGAGTLDNIMTIILPLSLRGILAGSALMFACGLGEFGATIIVAGNKRAAMEQVENEISIQALKAVAARYNITTFSVFAQRETTGPMRALTANEFPFKGNIVLREEI